MIATTAAAAATPVDAVVIGAGVVGLAIARTLALRGRDVLILDRASRIGSETSSRNSEVVHAGLYYPSTSHKARFCVRGRRLLYDYCRERHIYHNVCGKLVVATNKEQFETSLPALLDHAHRNGVKDAKLVSAEDVSLMEPHVQSHGALWSPSTGILDSHHYMTSLLADAEDHGATLALHSNVTNAKIITTTNQARGGRKVLLCVDDDMWLSCGIVVNSAGLWADQIARAMHNNDDWSPPQQYFCKGSYFRLQGIKSPFSHLIYPVPDPHGGLGVHATLDASGQTKFGPDVEWLDDKIANNPDEIDYSVDPERSQLFYSSIRRYWPDLPDDSLAPDYTGVRPKLSHPSSIVSNNNNSSSFQDFSIVGPNVHKVPGLVHLFGIESPGLTSSMAIAEYVAESLLRDDA